MTAKLRLQKVSQIELRRIFNEESYASRIAAGAYFEKLIREGHPSPPRSNEPPCTRSQILAYLDDAGRTVTIVHQYLRPDGTLGASGKPDPKKLFHSGVLYVIR